MCVAFALQKLLTFFQQKISAYLCIIDVNFNDSLTNNIVSFEQLGPGPFLQSLYLGCTFCGFCESFRCLCCYMNRDLEFPCPKHGHVSISSISAL